MCGVCGIAALRAPLDPQAEAAVARMMDALAHRGPDDAGIGVASRAILGATRLAIRGARAQQPLVDPATGIMVVCNGEIDNHGDLRAWLLERGRPVGQESDVAVLPGLYLELGDAFVERLVGPFAIAVWDPRGDRLLLARDRVGERPLFYVEHAGAVRFATVIAALAADPALPLSPDPDALRGYLRFGHFTAPDSPFASVRKVCPGETLLFTAGGAVPRRYWRWPLGTVPKRAPAEADLDVVLKRAVLRQMESDGDFGLFLSGGVDSSLVAALARDVRPDCRPPCYTLRFREESYDEGAPAAEVASLLGLALTEVWVEPDRIPEVLPGLVSLAGEPLADPAWIPTALLARRAAQEVKVALVGEGGDEVFGGYPTYPGAALAERFQRLPRPVRALLAALVRALPHSDKKVTIGFLLKRFMDGAGMDPVDRHLLWVSNIAPAILDRLGCAPPPGPSVEAAGAELLDVLQRVDLETSLAEGLLTKSDRGSMVSAVELRAPYLDVDVLSFAATLPAAERVRGLETKRFLKRFALRYLPRGIVHRRKRGLSVPLSAWLRGPLAGWARDRLAAGRVEALGVAASALLDEHRERRANHARAIWTLLVLEEWLSWVEQRRTRGSEGAPGADTAYPAPLPPGRTPTRLVVDG
jgi:asparagine synthase (glutamine-hydrolysing)